MLMPTGEWHRQTGVRGVVCDASRARSRRCTVEDFDCVWEGGLAVSVDDGMGGCSVKMCENV